MSGENGNTVGAGGSATLAENPLSSLEGLQGCLDHLQSNVLVADADLQLVYANPHAVETLKTLESEIRDVFGVSVNEIVGNSIHQFHSDPQRIEDILHDPSQLPRAATFSFGATTLKTSINSITNDGHVVGYIVNWDDISEEVIREAEMTRIHQMMENAPVNIMYADRDLVIRYINPASADTLRTLEQHLPCLVDEIVGQSVDIFHKDPSHQRGILANAKNLPRQANIEVGPETLDLLVSPILDQDGQHTGTMVTWSVITEQLETERKVREANEREREQAEELRAKVDAMLDVVNAAADGDLTKEIHVSGEDAIGQMGQQLSRFFTELRGNISAIGSSAQTLASASEELTSTSRQMGDTANETSAQATQVAAAAEQVDGNVQTVASAATQLNASIEDIARNTNSAANVATSAVEVAKSTNETIRKLGDSSTEIGTVIKVITSIAQQTNLLALNATIEAARAGEAGKGFAVVANEVKELAKETAKATEDISQRIEAIQADSTSAVDAISKIGEIINQINDLQTTIAGAVQEQAATTNEIGRSVAEASRGTSEISQNVGTVAQAASDTSQGAGHALDASQDLARMADDLKNLVSRFQV